MAFTCTTWSLSQTMTIRMPAINGVRCPKCGAENIPPNKNYVWRVADERGLHFECDVCAHDFQAKEFPEE